MQGRVKVDFTLNSNGEPIGVTAVSGHPMLKAAAEDNVKTWRLELPKNLYRTDWKYSTVFNFKISNDEQPYENPKLTVSLDSFHYVEVVTNPPSTKYAHDCPTSDEAMPPTLIQSGDLVELSRSGCYGTCPSYSVRVSEDGNVLWKGGGFVETVGERHSTITPEAAHALLQQFLAPRFWALCDGYDASVTDNPAMQVEERIGGRSKKVRNYADSAPQFERTFEDAVDAAAETHVLRHGDPRTEPLGNLFQDAYMPKPGVTPLMKAAANADTNSIQSILSSSKDVDAADSSGWTALMYAAASSHSEPVQLLLAAGANPNRKSLSGDTPLMASAISRSFDEDLVRAGADVNAQNSVGTTALMILAAKGEADEVAAALKAGANSRLRDAKGRTALDYVRLANCGESPV
ncbi:MAG TPA: ankyrin repeat domain-containing protein, partial [Candidatus Acidoferrum sp.]|nr:ankyrin repeat domain-containing protein [Candidatus Acidoferrum sp.]